MVNNRDLSKNSLSGTLPEELGYLPNVHSCYISNNLLTGTLPETLSHWTDIKEL